MSGNQFVIFEKKTADAESPIFKVSPRDSVHVNDTEHSAYIEIFTGAKGLGGGTLELHRQCSDGDYRNSEQETIQINAEFPTAETGVLVMPMNSKDNSNWKFILSDSTNPELTITGYNMQAGSE